MNAPKNNASDAMNSQIAELVVADARVRSSVRACGAVRRRPCARDSPSGDGWSGGHQCVLLARGLGRPCVEPEERDQRADPEQPPVLEHEAVAHDRQAEREHERPVRRRRHVDVVRLVRVAPSRDRRLGARRQLHQPALVVFGVLAVPELVAVRRRPGSRRSCTRAAATRSSTRASARPTGLPRSTRPCAT